MDKFADIEAFVAVVESGTFSAAGERLCIAKSVVSRRISQLEKRLGSQLLHRTTRRLSLTETGKDFYQRGVQVLADLDDAEQSISNQSKDLRGPIRLAAPLSFSMKHLSGPIASFLKEYRGIELVLDLNDRTVNLIEEGVDMAIRIAELEDSTMVARRLGTIRYMTCASEAYLKEHGRPEHPDDLQQHIGLQYSNMSYKQQWQYRSDTGKAVYAQPHIRIRANNGDALAAYAVAGLGVVAGPTFVLSPYLKAGTLVPLLCEYQRPSVGIYALYPEGRLMPKRVRVFSDFLAQQLGDFPEWDEGLPINEEASG